MSDTQIVEPATGQQVTVEDLQQMIEDHRKENETLTLERDRERTLRTQAEAGREAERQARIVTETERDGHAARVVSEAEQRYNAQKDSVKTGIEAQKGIIESAEEAYARHAELGDWKAAAAEQRRMAEASARLDRFETQSEFLETNKEKLLAPPPKQESRVVLPKPPGDSIAQLVKDVLPEEHAWLSKRPKFVDDPGYRAKVFAASNFATASGYQRGSEPYFREIERALGETDPAQEAPRTQTQPRSPSSDIAPQRRANPGAAPAGTKEWTLTPDQREIANDLYGNSTLDGYIADPGERYKHYHDMMEYQRARGRL